MKIKVGGLSEFRFMLYPRINEMKINEIESDFVEDNLTIHCSASLEERDLFFIWCDKRDLIAESSND